MLVGQERPHIELRAAGEVIVRHQHGLPAHPGVHRDAVADMDCVLNVDRWHAFPQRVQLRPVLVEEGHIAEQQVGQRISRPRTVELKLAVLVVAREKVVLAAHEVDTEG